MPTDFISLIKIFIDLIRALLPVVMGMAVLAFFWGLAKFIFRVSGDEKAVKEGKDFMIWGIIALFILISIWGIISFFSSELGFTAPLGFPLLPQ